MDLTSRAVVVNLAPGEQGTTVASVNTTNSVCPKGRRKWCWTRAVALLLPKSLSCQGPLEGGTL